MATRELVSREDTDCQSPGCKEWNNNQLSNEVLYRPEYSQSNQIITNNEKSVLVIILSEECVTGGCFIYLRSCIETNVITK